MRVKATRASSLFAIVASIITGASYADRSIQPQSISENLSKQQKVTSDSANTTFYKTMGKNIGAQAKLDGTAVVADNGPNAGSVNLTVGANSRPVIIVEQHDVNNIAVGK